MMQEYSISDIGLVITPEIAAYINLAADVQGECVPDEILALLDSGDFAEMAKHDAFGLPMDYGDVASAQDSLEMMNLEGVHCSEFTGNVSTINWDGTEIKNVAEGQFQESYEADFLCYIQAQKETSLFKSAYPDAKSLLDEFREHFKGVLPDDFDYAPYVCSISGTYLA